MTMAVSLMPTTKIKTANRSHDGDNGSGDYDDGSDDDDDDVDGGNDEGQGRKIKKAKVGLIFLLSLKTFGCMSLKNICAFTGKNYLGERPVA